MGLTAVSGLTGTVAGFMGPVAGLHGVSLGLTDAVVGLTGGVSSWNVRLQNTKYFPILISAQSKIYYTAEKHT